MRLVFLALLIAASSLAAEPKLTYIRSFPGSVPPYFEIKVDRTGALEYKESAADDHPLKAQLPSAQTDSLFALAGKLNYFKSPIESGLKVANTGKKTFRYEDENGTVSETVFNYSTSLDARDLLQDFENIAATENAYLELDSAMHYDKLGVNDALAVIESLWLNKQLADPPQFFPLLTRIASHESYMHLVRDRAARLKDEFQAANAPPQGDAQQK